MNKITKAVFPVAGLGSRFLPATKASPKEMMPVVDKPLIQYAVEEAVAAGITDLVFITGRNKRAIEDHFDTAYEIEAELYARGKTELLRAVQDVIPKNVNCIYIRQSEALGLGHAVLCAQPVVNNEPFAVILADDLIAGDISTIKQMVEVYQRHPCSILGVQDVPLMQTGNYGIVSSSVLEQNVEQVHAIIEKPRPSDAPSTLAVVGRYILTPGIFDHLSQLQTGAGGEIQLTDGISALIQNEKVLAYRFNGTRYDCGSKLGYLKASIAFGLKHSDTREEFAAYLKELCGKNEF
ncbi:UTP--glucose-1-phosphate uridylyltransferase GalU [Candidatus Nitrotoga fabula]|uniref:UTP--glucose-1-phosphate uridylyltransferase n=1 Tax=Candidatus Nitrotoga fabula TaxID=2182327 RepID=A0A916BB05_9PROT|nr:UTP--glucose-1-phosphate uridylyltransferase GalU [Candidatus Nitrotoga fabula]CAE6688735.1 UTP--glucose-1-phosphate uridylyltransferase [Candidatus Nitrotoga fabula]